MNREPLPERLIPSIPVLSPEEELKALHKEKEDHKFEIMRGDWAWPIQKEARRQYLMKKIAGPIHTPPPVPMQRMDAEVKTGFENSPMRRK